MLRFRTHQLRVFNSCAGDLTACRILLMWLTRVHALSKRACLLTSDLSSARRSDDRLKSNFHRVAMPPREEPSASRYSIAFFNNANKNSLVQVKLGLQTWSMHPPSYAAGHGPSCSQACRVLLRTSTLTMADPAMYSSTGSQG